MRPASPTAPGTSAGSNGSRKRSPPTIIGAMPRSRNRRPRGCWRSEEHTSELQSLMRNSYAVFCLKKKNDAAQVVSDKAEPERATVYNTLHDVYTTISTAHVI